ncbi:HEAT repeat domain containing protein [Acanthamoeba castellanii str. Neff]|uniref:HEAT repeat domain containing protein n=1 Tax=Acanthamoeba castellanii (strain ATCC 30010 / Neff) TaxID=1257118 RepID=L8HDT8_ACACF|nr:HEAT repeat domain containing protein [Acanthamoeba castellanii str. Neff]ELR22551.1 HEAT repeat domain containing protein [Acanthamoeba castellanii str. Neff]
MKVSVFVFDVQKQPALADVARNTLKRLKTLRHPSLVTYLDGLELPTTFYMVTERVTPLRDALPDIKTNEHHLSWGLCQVLKGLQFLNGDCQLVHGNVTLSSIFVSKAGDWKLGGLEFVSSPSESAPALKQQLELVDSRYHSPEVKRDAAAALQKMAPHAIDMYMYGCLLYEVFNGPLKSQEDLTSAVISPPTLRRPEPAQLVATCKYFSNPLVDALQFLENIALKDSHEKDTFFGKLGNQIDHFPKQLCTQKILPSLVTALDYGYANSRALGPLLKIGSQLPPDDYAARITPSVVKWFGSTDREMRTNLLSNIESFAEHLTPSLINDKIYTNLALGFSDLSPKLRELTIRSIVVLAPKYYDAEEVAKKVLPCLSMLAVDIEKQVRTAALQGLRLFLEKLEKHSELMVSSSAGTDPAGGDHSAASAMPGAAGGEGILGWALGSISKKANAQDAGGWGDDDDWAKEDSDDGGWGNDDDDDWGGVPRAHEEDEADVFAPPKKQPVASPLRPAATRTAVAPTSPSAEKKGIPGLRRAEAATATAKPFSSASSSSFSGVAAKPAAASATATAISSRASSSTRSFSLAAAKKVEPATAAAAAAAAASPARSYSSPTGKSSGGNAWGASDDEEEEGKGAGGWGDDGWGDAAGDGGDDDGWDFPAAASPSAARKNTGGGPSPSSPSAPATGLSKLEQRALLRNQKKNTGKKD